MKIFGTQMINIKTSIALLINAVIAYFDPIQGIIFAVGYAATVNFIVGFWADLRINHVGFNFAKGINAIKEVALYLAILASMFVISDHLKTDKDLIIKILTWITYALMYFYSTNIFKNLSRLLPNNRFINYLYYMLNMEFVNKILGLKNFLEKEKITK